MIDKSNSEIPDIAFFFIIRRRAVDPGLVSRATKDRLESGVKLTWADWSDIMQAVFDTYVAEHKTS